MEPSSLCIYHIKNRQELRKIGQSVQWYRLVFDDGLVYPNCIHKKEIGLTIVDRALAYQRLIMCAIHATDKQIFLNYMYEEEERKTNLTDGKLRV